MMKPILQSGRAQALVAAVAALLASPSAFAVDVRLCTTFGAVDIEIDERAAPRHAANFLGYVNAGFYDGTIVHRIVPGTMIQGGRFDPAYQERTPRAPVANESSNGLGNSRGTIAAARSTDPNSARSQFFINLTDNSHLNANNRTPGYTVFGRVTAGLNTLDRISGLPRQNRGNLQDVPVGLVEIQSAVVLEQSPVFGLSIESDPAQLSADLDRVSARGDNAATLAALDAMKRSCASLSPTQIIAGAQAAIALGQNDRARYLLEPYLAKADPRDPARVGAERLLRGLPPAAGGSLAAQNTPGPLPGQAQNLPPPVQNLPPPAQNLPAPVQDLPAQNVPAQTLPPQNLPVQNRPASAPNREIPVQNRPVSGRDFGAPVGGLTVPARAVDAPSRSADVLVGHCRRPFAPSVPNGRFSDRSSLQSVERSVLAYRQSSELYLNCVRQVLERTELNRDETTAVTRRYNDMVVEMTAVSVRFNQAVADFRSNQPGGQFGN